MSERSEPLDTWLLGPNRERVTRDLPPHAIAEGLRVLVGRAPAGGLFDKAVTERTRSHVDAETQEPVEGTFPLFLSPGMEYEVIVRRRRP
jgi:hypothetical protein